MHECNNEKKNKVRQQMLALRPYQDGEAKPIHAYRKYIAALVESCVPAFAENNTPAEASVFIFWLLGREFRRLQIHQVTTWKLAFSSNPFVFKQLIPSRKK